MTGRTAAQSMNTSPVSAADTARIRDEEEMHAHWRRRTVRIVAAAAHDAADCRMLLSILGLDDDVEAARAEQVSVGTVSSRPKAPGGSKAQDRTRARSARAVA